MTRTTALGLAVVLVLAGCGKKTPPEAGGPRTSLGFVDRTSDAGFDFENHTGRFEKKEYVVEAKGGGVLALDHDGDGDVDLYFVDGNRYELDGEGHVVTRTADPEAGNVLMRNDGDWTFTDVTKEAGVGDPSFGVAGTVGDIDNDGDPDIFVANWGRNVLYLNEGDGTFTDVTEAAGVGGDPALFSTCAAFLDADGDGFLDLYVSNYCDVEALMAKFGGESPAVAMEGVWMYPGPRLHEPQPDLFYRNRGDGTFEDVSATALADQRPSFGFQPVPFDTDGDGDLDLFVANDSVENFLWVNDGEGRFVERGEASGVATNEMRQAQAGMGGAAGDFDQDGRVDLVVTNFSSDWNTLYRNRSEAGSLLFEEVTARVGISLATFQKVSWGVALQDFDLDGRLDLFFMNGHVYPPAVSGGTYKGADYEETPSLLLGDGPPDWTFTDVSEQGGPGLRVARLGRAAVFADLDDDGDPDMAATCLNDCPLILENRLPRRGHWFRLSLTGTRSNRDAIGARVTVTAGDGEVRFTADHALATSFGATADPRMLIGLGAAEHIDRLTVRWPSGLTQEFKDLEADRSYHLTEGGEALASEE